MKKIKILTISLLTVSSIFSQKNDEIGRSWQKMHNSKNESLKEFNNAKFGMFIHFGIYSELAGYWKGAKINGIGECIMRYAEIPRSEYREAAKQFNPVEFNADAWVLAAKEAGMRYIVAMPKHADGFAMYNSKVTRWDIIDATPFNRDPIDELYKACKKYGIKFSIYFNYLDWMDGGNGRVKEYENENPNEEKSYQYWANTWDPSSRSFKDYFENKFKPQLRELLYRFPGMQELWHDMPMKLTPQQSFEVYQMVYKIQPQILENSRVGNNLGDFWVPGDNVIPDGKKVYDNNDILEKVQNLPWETPGTMNNTWGYRKDDNDWKSTEELLYWLTEITSKGGNYLLNIGPTGEGVFPEESLKRLKEIGEWMKINGESVYGTSKWIVNHEGPTTISINGTDTREKQGFKASISSQDFWFSQKRNSLYITSLRWPADQNVLIKSIKLLSKSEISQIQSIRLLGSDANIHWAIVENGLKVQLPPTKPDNHGYVLRITFKK